MDPSPYVHVALFTAGWLLLATETVATLLRPGVLVRHFPAMLLIALHALLAALFMDWLPVHDHLAFVSRSECATSTQCLQSGPWSAPTFEILNLVFATIPGPFGFYTNIAVQFGFTLLALGCLYGTLYGLALRDARVSHPRLLALLALAFVAFWPPVLRLATAGTFWSYTLANFFGAALAAEFARRRNSLLLWVAAAALLAFACASNFAVTPWGLLPAVALLCWARRPLRIPVSHVIAAAVFLAITVPVALHVSHTIQATHTEMRGLKESLSNLFILHPTQYPITLTLCVLAGLGVATRQLRVWGPLLAALWLVDIALAGQVPLENGYPTRFIHGFVSLFFLGALAAIGCERAISTAENHLSSPLRRHIPYAVIAIVFAGFPLAHQGIRFANAHSVASAEYAFIAQSAAQLPPHAALIIPPAFFQAISEAPESDPVEVQFPMAAYALASVESTGRATPVTLLGEGEYTIECPDNALFYLSAALRSWIPSEIDTNAFRQDPTRRPDLIEIERNFDLVPLRTTELSTAQAPLFTQRLTGDYADSATIGFYRIRCPEHQEPERVPERAAQRTQRGEQRAQPQSSPRTHRPPETFPVIPPGKESVIVGFLGADGLDGTFGADPSALASVEGISIQRSQFEITLRRGDTLQSLTFTHPDALGSEIEPIAQTQSFVVFGDCPTDQSHCAELIDTVRLHDLGDGEPWGTARQHVPERAFPYGAFLVLPLWFFERRRQAAA